MIDYVKFELIGVNKEQLLDHPNLDFKKVVSLTTGELDNKTIAEYHFCKITVYDSGSIFFSGSIHKMWNSLNNIKAPNHLYVKNYSGFNGNRYSLDDLYLTISHLQSLIDCRSNQMMFHNIEFGINCSLDFSPTLYVKGLLFHHNKLFEFRHNRSYAQVAHQRYIIKIYNKSLQYRMKKNVLRFEVKIAKMLELKYMGIKSFSDINRESLNKVFEMLLKRFDEVIHYDGTINKNNLSKKETNCLLNYQIPNYWIDELKPNHRDRHKKRLKKITLYNSENLHVNIKQSLLRECVIINPLSIWINTTQYTNLKTTSKVLKRAPLDRNISRFMAIYYAPFTLYQNYKLENVTSSL